jgi:hypothetical protein
MAFDTISTILESNQSITIMFVIYSSPIKFTKDLDHARIIAEDYFQKTAKIVAIEEIDTTKEFHTTSL